MGNMENDTNADFSTMGNPLYSIAISLKRIADVICRPPVVAEMTPEELKAMEKEYKLPGNIVNKS